MPNFNAGHLTMEGGDFEFGAQNPAKGVGSRREAPGMLRAVSLGSKEDLPNMIILRINLLNSMTNKYYSFTSLATLHQNPNNNPF